VVEHKDVVLALLGASAALAGLVLVFLGLVISAYSNLGAAPKGSKAPYRRSGVALLGAFRVGVSCLVVGLCELLLLHNNQYLYVTTVILFLGQIGALLGTSIWVAMELLWD
jgi:uncharacterized membrane protein